MLIEEPNNEDEEGEKQPEGDPETETEVAEPSTEEEDAAVGPVQQMELKKLDSQELEQMAQSQEVMRSLAGALMAADMLEKTLKKGKKKIKEEETVGEEEGLADLTKQELEGFLAKKSKMMPFTEVGRDEYRGANQCRPLKETLWRKYTRDLLEIGLSRQPVQALGWQDGSMSFCICFYSHNLPNFLAQGGFFILGMQHLQRHCWIYRRRGNGMGRRCQRH